jgi:hypothetical protein
MKDRGQLARDARVAEVSQAPALASDDRCSQVVVERQLAEKLRS